MQRVMTLWTQQDQVRRVIVSFRARDFVFCGNLFVSAVDVMNVSVFDGLSTKPAAVFVTSKDIVPDGCRNRLHGNHSAFPGLS